MDASDVANAKTIESVAVLRKVAYYDYDELTRERFDKLYADRTEEERDHLWAKVVTTADYHGATSGDPELALVIEDERDNEDLDTAHYDMTSNKRDLIDVLEETLGTKWDAKVLAKLKKD